MAMVSVVRRFLCIGAVFILVVFSTDAFSSTSRLRSLGDETRILIDDSNIFVYSGRIPQYTEVIAEPFDDWAGVVYGVGGGSTVGLMLERPVSSAVELKGELQRRFSGRALGGLNVTPWFDLLYGLQLGRIGIGCQVSFAYAREAKASASATEIRTGLTTDLSGERTLDVTVGLSLKGFHEDSPEVMIESKGGVSIDLEGRAFFPVGSSTSVIPTAGLSFGGLDVDSNESTFFDALVGVGANIEMLRGSEVITGVFFELKSEEEVPSDGGKTRSRTISLPRLVIGAEYPVTGSFVTRVGMKRSTVLRTDEHMEDGEVVQTWGFSTKFDLDMGFGFKFGSISLDGILEKDFLRDLANIIGGGKHGGGFFSSATLTYSF